ncbi:Epi-inositol hydrolase [Cronobacter sakazakii 696]|nr:Epi-inositol hydrolase [Cronobacter sakazakii 696]
MGKLRLTMAQALVKFLDNQYLEVDGETVKFVKGIFAIFGHGNVLGLGQALEQDSGELRLYQGRNEQGMAHAATGFARQSLRRQILACTSSVGPGAANMITAARRRPTAFRFCCCRAMSSPPASPIRCCSR